MNGCVRVDDHRGKELPREEAFALPGKHLKMMKEQEWWEMNQLGMEQLAHPPVMMLMDYMLSLLKGDQICKLAQICIYHSGCKRCKEEPPVAKGDQ